MSRIIACDIGFGRVKAASSEKQIEFPSVVAQFSPLRYTTGIAEKDILQNLCIEYQRQQLFVGEIVFRQKATAQVRMNSDRFTKPEGMALMLAALSLLANDEPIKVVAGLPVSDYAGKREEYTKALTGKHEIRFLHPDGSLLENYRLNIEAAKVLPQPAGSYFNRILDREGNLIDRFLANGSCGILDIGHNTVDLARFDQVEFVDRESESFSDLGMFEGYKMLSREIKAAHGIEIRPAEMENYARNGVIPGARPRSIVTEKRKVYSEQAEKIVARASNVWRDMWQMNRILITGGGAAGMGEFLLKQFDDQRQVEVCGNATMTNCNGFLRYGKRVWSS